MKITIIFISLFIICSCSNTDKSRQIKVKKIINSRQVSNKSDVKIDSLTINCDSIYPNKSFQLTLITFDTSNEEDIENNSVFIFSKVINDKVVEIFRDSVYSKVQAIEFHDFNGDKIKDILVQNISDARSNWTYNLYLMNNKKGSLKKIRGFNEIKNPLFDIKYKVIANYVNSGTNWTEFYKIKGDSVINCGITIHDNTKKDIQGKEYQRDYQKAISKI